MAFVTQGAVILSEATVCWQKKKKDEYALANNNAVPVANFNESEIVQINYCDAKQFIEAYEWLGNMGTSQHCYGLLFSGYLAAVVCYGPLVATSKYGRLFSSVNEAKLCQICRGASTYWAPNWSASKLIRSSLKMIFESYGYNLVIAYADPAAGEIGTIYQACNALYLGMTSPGGAKKYVIHGHIYSPIRVYRKYGSREKSHLQKIDPNYTTIPIAPKHRYLFIQGTRYFRKKMKLHLMNYVQPYPKRSNYKV